MRTLLTEWLESAEHVAGTRPGQREGKVGMGTQKSGWMLGENCPEDGHGCLQPLAAPPVPSSLLQLIRALQA